MLLKYPRGSGTGELVGEQEHKKWEQSRDLTNKFQIGLGFKPPGGGGRGEETPIGKGGGCSSSRFGVEISDFGLT